eukprot:1143541-Pelagomonas_calceolata.AAC.3
MPPNHLGNSSSCGNGGGAAGALLQGLACLGEPLGGPPGGHTHAHQERLSRLRGPLLASLSRHEGSSLGGSRAAGTPAYQGSLGSGRLMGGGVGSRGLAVEPVGGDSQLSAPPAAAAGYAALAMEPEAEGSRIGVEQGTPPPQVTGARGTVRPVTTAATAATPPPPHVAATGVSGGGNRLLERGLGQRQQQQQQQQLHAHLGLGRSRGREYNQGIGSAAEIQQEQEGEEGPWEKEEEEEGDDASSQPPFDLCPQLPPLSSPGSKGPEQNFAAPTAAAAAAAAAARTAAAAISSHATSDTMNPTANAEKLQTAFRRPPPMAPPPSREPLHLLRGFKPTPQQKPNLLHSRAPEQAQHAQHAQQARCVAAQDVKFKSSAEGSWQQSSLQEQHAEQAQHAADPLPKLPKGRGAVSLLSPAQRASLGLGPLQGVKGGGARAFGGACGDGGGALQRASLGLGPLQGVRGGVSAFGGAFRGGDGGDHGDAAGGWGGASGIVQQNDVQSSCHDGQPGVSLLEQELMDAAGLGSGPTSSPPPSHPHHIGHQQLPHHRRKQQPQQQQQLQLLAQKGLEEQQDLHCQQQQQQQQPSQEAGILLKRKLLGGTKHGAVFPNKSAGGGVADVRDQKGNDQKGHRSQACVFRKDDTGNL